MTLQQFNYIITIAKCGSMRKAAEELYVAQPSLTGAVQDLERELGFKIFVRSKVGTSLTPEGQVFVQDAGVIYQQFELMVDKYNADIKIRKKFSVSTQHYSFAVKAFVETAKRYDLSEFDFLIKETKTQDVIDDVIQHKSEIGVLMISDFNRAAMKKLIEKGSLEFHKILDAKAYVYIWKGHPLAHKKEITFDELQDYPCLSFIQHDGDSMFLNEEILTESEYRKTIKANDRATMLNLMHGLNGYTLCCGVINEELNGSEYIAVPFREDEINKNCNMEIGYIINEKQLLSDTARVYIEQLIEQCRGTQKEVDSNDRK